jgi:hypothetical protein
MSDATDVGVRVENADWALGGGDVTEQYDGQRASEDAAEG